MLWGQELRDRLNDESLTWLTASSLTPTLVQRVGNALPCDTDMTAADLRRPLSFNEALLRENGAMPAVSTMMS